MTIKDAAKKKKDTEGGFEVYEMGSSQSVEWPNDRDEDEKDIPVRERTYRYDSYRLSHFFEDEATGLLINPICRFLKKLFRESALSSHCSKHCRGLHAFGIHGDRTRGL